MSINFEILDSITESMTVINNIGKILYTNKAWRSFSLENMGNNSYTDDNYLTICDTVKGEESKMAKDANIGIKKVINGELDIFEMEYPCHSPTENRWFILRASKVIANPELTLLAHINITNRKIAELEVEKNYIKSLVINERLNTTLYKIVHDIQNPLSGIIGLIALSKSENDTKVLNKHLEMIEKGSANLNLFVQETLKHISTSEETQSVNVNSITTEYLETIEPLLRLNSIDIKLDIQQKGEFYTNAIEFRSILSNLISNLIKYCDKMKSDKFIKIKFSSDSNRAVFKVEDNGVGIKKEDVPKLMQRNYQVNKKTSDGVGLGLFMVEKSVILLGGTININSNFGIGTEFIVKIPNRIKKES